MPRNIHSYFRKLCKAWNLKKNCQSYDNQRQSHKSLNNKSDMLVVDENELYSNQCLYDQAMCLNCFSMVD